MDKEFRNREDEAGRLHGRIVSLSRDLDEITRTFSFVRSALKHDHRRLLDEAEELTREARDKVFQVGNEMEPAG